MFPLQFMGMLGRFELECTVSGGGRSSQAGALRLAVSRALLSFLSEREVETMRQGGPLLFAAGGLHVFFLNHFLNIILKESLCAH